VNVVAAKRFSPICDKRIRTRGARADVLVPVPKQKGEHYEDDKRDQCRQAQSFSKFVVHEQRIASVVSSHTGGTAWGSAAQIVRVGCHR